MLRLLSRHKSTILKAYTYLLQAIQRTAHTNHRPKKLAVAVLTVLSAEVHKVLDFLHRSTIHLLTKSVDVKHINICKSNNCKQRVRVINC